MDNLSITSVLDLQLSSDDEEIMMKAQCVELDFSAPIPVPGPSTSKFRSTNLQNKPSKRELPKPDCSPQPIFDQSFFSLGKGNGPIRRDDRIRNNHPIKLYIGSLFPMLTLLCHRRLKIKDHPILPSQITLYIQSLSSPWIQLRTTSEGWNLIEMAHWRIAQSA